MTAEQWGDLARTLGIASPLVGLLIYLLRQATEERQNITDRFLSALESTVAGATKAIQDNTAATRELSVSIEANRKSNIDEHTRIVDAIGKLNRRGES